MTNNRIAKEEAILAKRKEQTPKSQVKPPTRGKGKRSPSSPYQKGNSFGCKKGRKR